MSTDNADNGAFYGVKSSEGNSALCALCLAPVHISPFPFLWFGMCVGVGVCVCAVEFTLSFIQPVRPSSEK